MAPSKENCHHRASGHSSLPGVITSTPMSSDSNEFPLTLRGSQDDFHG